jgi:DNA mismatch repair protein MutH
MTTRPTLAFISSHFDAVVKGKTFTLPKEKNKGRPGHLLEELLGIPKSSACLDCEDGELKSFPLTSAGKPKETVAVTMVQKEDLKTTAFRESRVYKKLKNTVFVSYSRAGDEIVFTRLIPLSLDTREDICSQLEKDYNDIQEHAQKDEFSSSLGTWLQTRTKGAGHGSTSRAFYLRTQFLSKLLAE